MQTLRIAPHTITKSAPRLLIRSNSKTVRPLPDSSGGGSTVWEQTNRTRCASLPLPASPTARPSGSPTATTAPALTRSPRRGGPMPLRGRGSMLMYTVTTCACRSGGDPFVRAAAVGGFMPPARLRRRG